MLKKKFFLSILKLGNLSITISVINITTLQRTGYKLLLYIDNQIRSLVGNGDISMQSLFPIINFFSVHSIYINCASEDTEWDILTVMLNSYNKSSRRPPGKKLITEFHKVLAKMNKHT